MSYHYYLTVKLSPKQIDDWSDDEVTGHCPFLGLLVLWIDSIFAIGNRLLFIAD